MALDGELQLNQSLTLIERHALLEEIYIQLAQFPIPPSIELNDLPDDVLSAPEVSMHDPVPLLPRFTGAHPNKWIAYAERNALQVYDEMPDCINNGMVNAVHETMDDEGFKIQNDLVVDVHDSLGVIVAQMDVSNSIIVLARVKPCLNLVLADVSKEADMVETNVYNDDTLADSFVINSFAWKPGWVANHVQVSPRKFIVLAVSTLKFQFDKFAMVITSSYAHFGGPLQVTDSGFVPIPPTITVVCDKHKSIGTFGSLLSGSYFVAGWLRRTFSFDPGPNSIYMPYSYCIINTFEPINTLVLEFGTSISVHQGLSALQFYFLDGDPNPTDACTTLTDKYSTQRSSAWYYTGNQYIDENATICYQRALVVFALDSESRGVNVRAYSCTTTNFAAYTSFLSPGDRIIVFDTPSGGHTSQGYYTINGQKVSGASIFFKSFSENVDLKACVVDFEKHEAWAVDFHPKILNCGWFIFHKKGLFSYKGVLLTQVNSNDWYDLEEKIYFVAWPALPGGPHLHHNAAFYLIFALTVDLPWKPPWCSFSFALNQCVHHYMRQPLLVVRYETTSLVSLESMATLVSLLLAWGCIRGGMQTPVANSLHILVLKFYIEDQATLVPLKGLLTRGNFYKSLLNDELVLGTNRSKWASGFFTQSVPNDVFQQDGYVIWMIPWLGVVAAVQNQLLMLHDFWAAIIDIIHANSGSQIAINSRDAHWLMANTVSISCGLQCIRVAWSITLMHRRNNLKGVTFDQIHPRRSHVHDTTERKEMNGIKVWIENTYWRRGLINTSAVEGNLFFTDEAREMSLMCCYIIQKRAYKSQSQTNQFCHSQLRIATMSMSQSQHSYWVLLKPNMTWRIMLKYFTVCIQMAKSIFSKPKFCWRWACIALNLIWAKYYICTRTRLARLIQLIINVEDVVIIPGSAQFKQRNYSGNLKTFGLPFAIKVFSDLSQTENAIVFLPVIPSIDACFGHKPPDIQQINALHLEDKVYLKGGSNVMNLDLAQKRSIKPGPIKQPNKRNGN